MKMLTTIDLKDIDFYSLTSTQAKELIRLVANAQCSTAFEKEVAEMLVPKWTVKDIESGDVATMRSVMLEVANAVKDEAAELAAKYVTYEQFIRHTINLERIVDDILSGDKH